MMSASFLFSHQKTKDGEHLRNRIIQYNVSIQALGSGSPGASGYCSLGDFTGKCPCTLLMPFGEDAGRDGPRVQPSTALSWSYLHFSSTKCPPRPPLPTSLTETCLPGSDGLIWRLPASGKQLQSGWHLEGRLPRGSGAAIFL